MYKKNKMGIRSKKERIKCEYCRVDIDLKKNKFVLLGTYFGKKTQGESYFHFQCFKRKWEERVKEQAQNIVGQMAKKVMPMAKQLAGSIAGVDIDKEVNIDDL